MTITIGVSSRGNILAKLCVYAYEHGWRLGYASLETTTEIKTVEDARKIIESYGQNYIERNLSVDLDGMYFDSYEFDLRFGSAWHALHPELVEKLS